MDYLEQFNQDLLSGRVPIRSNYVDPTSRKLSDEIDVVTDLIEHHRQYAVACLPIAKQIVACDRKVNLLLPKIGDLFVGLVHHPVIDQVNVILNNYTEECVVEGHLVQVKDLLLWKITDLPIPLFPIDDYERLNLSVHISLTHQYNLQSANQEVFRACYGYLNHSLKERVSTQVVTQIPLLDSQHHLRIVCGLWTIVGQ